MQQILVRIPWIDIPIFGFGAMLFVAFLTCTWLAARRGRRVGLAPENVQDLAIWLFVGGLLGARITYLLLDKGPPLGNNFFQWLGNFLWQLPRIWDGGIILYGSIVGGILGYAVFYWISFRRHGIATLQLADILAPSVALGIAFGRIGCFLNGCCYGSVACAACAVYPVHFPLSAPPRYALVHAGYQTAAGFTYDDDQPSGFVRVGRVEPGSPAWEAGLRPGSLIYQAGDESLANSPPDTPVDRLNRYLEEGWERGQNQLTLTVRDKPDGDQSTITIAPRTIGLHPTQLYETVSMFLLFLVLMSLDTLRPRQGLLAAVLMMGYAVHRALNELLRDDPRPVGSERYFSYVLFAAGVALAVYVLRRGRKVQAEVPPASPGRPEIIAAGASGRA
jgi:prolipoprotein diacylglyceryltransferase